MEVTDTRTERARLQDHFAIMGAAWAHDSHMVDAVNRLHRRNLDQLACLDERRAIAGTLDQLVTVPAWRLAVRVKTLRADAAYQKRRERLDSDRRYRRWEAAAFLQNGGCDWMEGSGAGGYHHEIHCKDAATHECTEGGRYCTKHAAEWVKEGGSALALPAIRY